MVPRQVYLHTQNHAAFVHQSYSTTKLPLFLPFVYGVAVFTGTSCLHISARFDANDVCDEASRPAVFPILPFSLSLPFPSFPFAVKASRIYETSSWFGKISCPPTSATYRVYYSRPHELSHFAKENASRAAYLNVSQHERPLYVLQPDTFSQRQPGGWGILKRRRNR